jgi:hypothetical protein
MKWPWQREAKVEPPKSLELQLLEACAELASLKARPVSDFVSINPYIYGFSVDNKDKAIARKKAEIARLQVLVGEKREMSQPYRQFCFNGHTAPQSSWG